MWGRVNKIDSVRPEPGRQAAALAPVADYLAELHARVAEMTGGKPADYIPELGKADPALFGIAVATVDGQVYAVGDTDAAFTIQSVSKPFMYGYALQHHGRAAVLKHVGVEPTGEAFNSIVLDEAMNRPFNPMVNAGAIAVAELMDGDTHKQRIDNMLGLFSSLAGRKLEIDEAVYRSELATGHRNRAIAYMMLNSAMIERDPNEVLDLYFRQCSVNVTCRDLAIMAATLANDGRNPLTAEAVLETQYVRDMLSVMNSCGMYDYAGEWAYEVGMPAKSGVSGCIIAVIPGQIGICVYSPPIDKQGNSVRGIRVCQEISSEFELHAFNNRTNVRSVIRRDYRADLVRSNRLRTPEERKILAEKGDRIAVLEAQGPLFFGAAEQLLRRLSQLAAEASYVIVDFKRVHLADTAARKLIVRGARAMAGGATELLFASMADDGPLGALVQALSERDNEHLVRMFRDADAALEWCEDKVLDDGMRGSLGDQIRAVGDQFVQGLEAGRVPIAGIDRPAAGVRQGRRHHPRGRRGQSVLRAGARHGQRSDQGARARRAQEAGGLDRTRLELRRDGAARRRQALGRHHRRRAGDLLRAPGRAAARADGRASQHHDHHSQQSDARILRAPAPCQ